MDRPHTQDMLQQAYDHKGSAFIEIYQNCNVFNDKAFIKLTGREEREINRINLEHGKPVVFGPEDQWGVVMEKGAARVVDVSAVGIDRIHVHDAEADSPSAAFALTRLSHSPIGPTPVGVFRKVQRPTYETTLQQQIHDAQASRGPGDLSKLIASTGTWTVEG
jgi:2-oxoglutarate ferredoxin oxidoreductase subunit beta